MERATSDLQLRALAEVDYDCPRQLARCETFGRFAATLLFGIVDQFRQQIYSKYLNNNTIMHCVIENRLSVTVKTFKLKMLVSMFAIITFSTELITLRRCRPSH